VLRGGKVTGVCNPRQESNASLSRLMIGAEPPALEHRAVQTGATVLRVQGLSLPRADQFGVDLIDVECRCARARWWALPGSRATASASCCTRCRAKTSAPQPASIQVAGQNAGRMGPGQRRALGLHFVPEERLGRGAVPTWAWRTTCC
jgi:ABC-type uncharacterized transport system ATPase subunit